MGVNRVFLGWDRPILEQSIEWLLAQTQPQQGIYNLSEFTLVSAGSRTGRFLLDKLLLEAERRDCRLIPPRFSTIGSVPELIAEVDQQHPTRTVLKLCWLEVLKDTEPDLLSALMPLQTRSVRALTALAEELVTLKSELGAGGYTFFNLAEMVEQNELPFEDQRWELLAELESDYLRLLKSKELYDLTDRRNQLLSKGEFSPHTKIVLIGTADLPLIARKFLSCCNTEVYSLIFAPADLTDSFSEYGTVLPEKWEDAQIPLNPDLIHSGKSDVDQSRLVLNWLKEISDQYKTSQISIGISSTEIAPILQSQLERCGIKSELSTGVPLNHSPLFVLLQSIFEYIQYPDSERVARLIRHPLFAELFEVDSSTLRDLSPLLDDYQAKHFQASLNAESPAGAERYQLLHSTVLKIDQTLRELNNCEQSITDWLNALLELVNIVLQKIKLSDSEEALAHSLCSICSDINTFSGPQQVGSGLIALFEVILGELSKCAAPQPADPASIEILGWLELLTDPAEALCIVGMNEGAIPESINEDPFLPNSARSRLGITDNTHRTARDKYILSALVQSKQKIQLIFGKTNSEGDPLLPSRLLFCCEDRELPQRVLSLYKDPGLQFQLNTGRKPLSGFPCIPEPVPLESAPEIVTVSGLNLYQSCPYRFYLRHILGLRAVDDLSWELPANTFGEVVHKVLEQFGKSAVKDSEIASDIYDFLSEALTKLALEQFGASAFPAIRLQIEQARERLRYFAEWQARHTQAGWRIQSVEETLGGQNRNIELPNGSITLTARIDRIDSHTDTGEGLIIDYKSSDMNISVDKRHLHKGEWFAFQLPAYHFLLSGGDAEARIRLGILNLGSSSEETTLSEANWDSLQLEQAWVAMRQAAAGIVDQIYWPPAEDYLYDDFAAIFEGTYYEEANE